MAKIIAGMGISHAPGALGWPEAPAADVRQRVEAAARELGRRLEAAEPDVIVAFLDDHFENLFRNLMPTVAIGVAESHVGPAKQWLEALRLTEQKHYPGAPEFAEALLRHAVNQGLDVARMGLIEYGNNLLVPLETMGVTRPIAIVPIFINVFSPPLMPYARALEFGKALRTAVEQMDVPLRVAFLATGGLSHWPPFWTDGSDKDDEFLQKRMKVFQSQGPSYLHDDPALYTDLAEYEIRMANEQRAAGPAGRPLVNEEWDLSFLRVLQRGDETAARAYTFDAVERDGGHGGHEILNWIALMGAMGSVPAELLAYEAVPEWICGMAYVDFPVVAR